MPVLNEVVKVFGNPIKLSNMAETGIRRAPKLGEDNIVILREMLGLNKPIYEKTAAYGHFGRMVESNGSFSWEKTDKTGIFSK